VTRSRTIRWEEDGMTHTFTLPDVEANGVTALGCWVKPSPFPGTRPWEWVIYNMPDTAAATRRSAWGLESADTDNWRDRSLCNQVDPEMWFPDKGGSTKEAKKVCQGCEVRTECLQYALDHDERFGIWGGLSEPERRKLKRGAAA
jgi:WhiB family redox-sensing transcriptional regulator